MRRFLFLLKLNFKDKNDVHLGGSPGLVVMGRDSSGFESWHWMDIFSHIVVVKIVMMFV